MVVDYQVLYMIMQSSPYLGYYYLSKQKWNVEGVLSCDAIDQTSQIRLEPPQGFRIFNRPTRTMAVDASSASFRVKRVLPTAFISITPKPNLLIQAYH